jgi:hypothetical protein
MPFAEDDELAPGSEGWPPLGAKGDLELLPEEEVFESRSCRLRRTLGTTASKSLRSSSIR